MSKKEPKKKTIFYRIDVPELKRVIRKSCVSQVKLGETCGVPMNYLSAYSTGRFNPTSEHLALICRFFKVTKKRLKAEKIEVLD